MIDKNDKEISINNQCNIIGLSKSTLYYNKKSKYSEKDREILNRIDEIYTKTPCYGYKKIHYKLLEEKFSIGKDRVLKYMKILGVEAIYPKKKKCLSKKNKEHKKYPYLLKDLEIEYPNQVWATDITYIRMKQGFMYLVVVIDWYSRYILSYNLSNSLDIYFCKESLYEALEKYGKPLIFNTDQGSQFTSNKFTKILIEKDIKISMTSKGRALDNIIIERFFRTLKYEDIYINEYNSPIELAKGIENYIYFYNKKRIHQSLKYKTPYKYYKAI